MAAIAALAVSACAGEEGSDDAVEDTGAPAQTAPATDAANGMAMDLPEGVTQEQADAGRQLFAGRAGCAACHGPQAAGTQLGPDLTDDEWINVSGRDYDEIVELIRTGVPQPQEHPGPMPPMGGQSLNDAEIDALAAYVYGISQG